MRRIGIEIGTNKLPLDVISETCGQAVADVSTFLVSVPIGARMCGLLNRIVTPQSGPSFAKEIVKRQPTQVSVCSTSIEHAQKTAELFHQPHFRC